MAKQIPQIREEIETTRDALSEKLEILEERTRNSITQTKDKVKQTFELHYQMKQRPWTMMGLAVACGYVVGHLAASKGKVEIPRPFRKGGAHTFEKQTDYNSWKPKESHDSVALLKGVALSAVSSLVHDVVKQIVPRLTEALYPQKSNSNSPSSASSYPEKENTAEFLQSPAD